MNNKTIKQHYVHKRLIEQWKSDRFVGRANIVNNLYLEKLFHKSPRNTFCKPYLYESFYGFESADQHFINDFSSKTDDNHSFNTNDVERYLGRTESAAWPVINNLITLGISSRPPRSIKLTEKEKVYLSEYLILQSMRTPRGRRKYQYNYEKKHVSINASDELVWDQYSKNMIYQFLLGTYNDYGLSDKHNLEKAPFFHFAGLIKNMNIYILTLNLDGSNQYILSDDPCIILGAFSIFGLLMPLSPKVLLLMISNTSKEDNSSVFFKKCPRDIYLLEIWSQIALGQTEVVYCEEISGISKINSARRRARHKLIINLPFWDFSKLAALESKNEKIVEELRRKDEHILKSPQVMKLVNELNKL